MHLNWGPRFQGTYPQASQTDFGKAKITCRTIQTNSL